MNGFEPVDGILSINGFSPFDPNEGGDVVTQRIFIDLDQVLMSSYLLATPETFTGNLKISYATTTTATEMDFSDGFGITSGGIFKAPASVTDIELNGVSVGLGAAAPLDGKENTVVFVDAVSETITGFGQSGSNTNYFDGILSSPSIPGATFLLGQATGNTEYSEENTFGPELSDEPTTFNSPWVDDGGSAYSIDGSQAGFTNLFFSSLFSGDAAFKVTYIITNYVAGAVRILNANMNGISRSGNGTFTEVFNNGSNNNANFEADPDFDGTVSAISIKEIEGNALTYDKIPEANRELFQLSGDQTQWDNISPPVQVLPAIIEVA